MTILIIIALAGIGMIFGSFANALVWRFHGQDELHDKLEDLQRQKPGKTRDRRQLALQTELDSLSMSKGRSMCSKCHQPLAPKDLIPLFSWLWLRGKCRYCRQPIEDTPWLEALLPLAFVVSYVFWPLSFEGYGLVSFGFWLMFLVGFAALTVYDLRWYLLPDRIVWPLVGLAVLQMLIHVVFYSGDFSALIAAFWGVITASGIFYALYQLSKGEWIGGGDVKLGIVLGLLVGGPLKGLLVLFLASLLGTLASIPMLVQGKLKRQAVIPFGPFLMVATGILVVFGDQLVTQLDRLVDAGL